jgi:AraC-like DNA-binding protein
MVNCGYEKCSPHFGTSTHIRPYYLLHFVSNGEGVFVQNDSSYDISAGSVFSIFPDNVVSYSSTNPDNSLHFCWIGLSGTKAKYLLERLGLTTDNPVVSLLNIHMIYSIISTLTVTIHKNRFTSSNHIKSTIYQLLYLIEKSQAPHNPGLEHIDHTNHLAWSIAAYIEYHCTSSLNIREIAEHFNIDRTYMWKIFNKHVGIPPKTYLINCRISRAKSLMQLTDKTIKDIALSCGIPDVCHFHKLFTQYEGVTPKQYLKSQRLFIQSQLSSPDV